MTSVEALKDERGGNWMGTTGIHTDSVFFVSYRWSTENSNIYFLLKLLYRSFKMGLFS